MYAIVRTGGKQYRVEEGRSITVERLPAEEGATVELGEVLLIADDGEVTVGTPVIEGARVLATVEELGKRPKVVVFKYKAKVRTRKKTGHRQPFTRLAVKEILRPGQVSKEEAKPKRARRRKAEEEAPAEAPQAAVEAVETPAIEAAPVAEAPAAEAEAPAAPKRRTPARRKTETADTTKAPARKRTPARKTAAKAKETGAAPAAKTARQRAARKTTKKETE